MKALVILSLAVAVMWAFVTNAVLVLEHLEQRQRVAAGEAPGAARPQVYLPRLAATAFLLFVAVIWL